MSLLGKIAIVTGGGSGIEDAVRQMVEETAASHGRLDYLFKQRRHRHRGRCPRPDLRALAPGTRRGPVRGHLRHARRLPDHDPAGIRHIVNTSSSAGLLPGPFNAPTTPASTPSSGCPCRCASKQPIWG